MTATSPPDFWLSSGFHLLDRDAAGHLLPTDDFLRAYFERPEVRPIPESGPAELALHRALVDDPRRPVGADALAAIEDPDARDNYALVLRFRDFLLSHGTIEAAYLALFRAGAIDLPPLFIDQLAHMALRNVLDGTADPLRPRTGELLFRTQRVSLESGAVLLADDETVEMYANSGGIGPIGRLLAGSQPTVRGIELDVLSPDNGALYWARSDRFDMVVDVGFGRPGLDALARVLEAWVAHFLGVDVSIQPVQSIRDERWVWHVGLDGEATAIMNALYDGAAVDEARMARVLALFRLEFRDPSRMLARVAGRPVYLAHGHDARPAPAPQAPKSPGQSTARGAGMMASALDAPSLQPKTSVSNRCHP